MGYWDKGIKSPVIIVEYKGYINIDNSEYKNLEFNQKIISKNKTRLAIKTINKDLYRTFEIYLPLFFLNNNPDNLSSKQLQRILKEIKDFSKLIFSKKKIMSMEVITGLYGELLFIKDLIKSKLSIPDIIEAWQQEGNKHNDFIFNDKEYELKTTTNNNELIINISSEYQLFSFNRQKVFLCVKTIKRDKNGLSLDNLIDEIKSKLIKNKISLFNFNKKLLIYGYRSCGNSKNKLFSEETTNLIKVDNKFPKLTVDEIPRNVFDLKYKIKLSPNS